MACAGALRVIQGEIDMKYPKYALAWALVLYVYAGAASAAETSMVFDGVKPHVELPGEPNFDFTTAMTVEAWVKFDKHPVLPQK